LSPPATSSRRAGTARSRGVTAMTIDIVVVEEITATRIHLDPDAGGA
jgi:hypothetical protein